MKNSVGFLCVLFYDVLSERMSVYKYKKEIFNWWDLFIGVKKSCLGYIRLFDFKVKNVVI